MKVTGVKVTPYACPPAGKPAGRHATSGCIVELLTDSDLTGIAIGADGAGAQIERFVAEMLVGADPRATTAIWQTHVGRCRRNVGERDSPATTIAALDIALWDLKAKANAEPLWKTLGGTRPRANAHAGGIALTATDQELAGWYGSMARDYGLRGAKLRVGLDEEPDLARLALMRTALQHGTTAPTLVVDAEQRWTPKQAIRRLRDMEREFDVAWVEGATRSWDFPGLKQISNAISAAVCVGGDLAHARGIPASFSAPLRRCHPARHRRRRYHGSARAGGRRIRLRASRHAGGIAGQHPRSPLERDALLHEHGGRRAARAWPVFATDVRIEAGWAIAGDAPGNGLTVDREALGRATVRAGR